MTVIDLVGVLEDGSPLGYGVPVDTRRGIQLARGASVLIRLSTTNADGTVPDLTAATLRLGIKRLTSSDDYTTVTGVASERGLGCTDFTLASAVTLSLGPGRHAYDVWATIDSEKHQLIGLSPLFLKPPTL